MECPNCTFQNAPGTPRCGRCQSCLQLAGVDVIPPRAVPGIGGVLQRRMDASRRRTAGAVAGLRRSLCRPWMGEVRWPALVWSVVPGLGQVRYGNRNGGLAILAAWAMLLLGAAASLGLARSWFLAMTAVSVHSVAFSLVLHPVLQRMTLPCRALAGFALYGALVGAIYYPAYAGATSVFRVLPMGGLRPDLSLRNGDVLLYTGERTRPETWRRGDLAVCRIDPAMQNGALLREGFAVDRIVGLPGDHVVFDGGVLLVNGEPPPPEAAPIRGLDGIPELDIRVGADEYVVLFTAMRWRQANGGEGGLQGIVEGAVRGLARVPETHLVGRAFWRARPLGRAGRV